MFINRKDRNEVLEILEDEPIVRPDDEKIDALDNTINELLWADFNIPLEEPQWSILAALMPWQEVHWTDSLIKLFSLFGENRVSLHVEDKKVESPEVKPVTST